MERPGTIFPPTSAPPSEELLQQAFALLRELITQFETQHKRPLAATLKAAMVDRTYGGFDERRLGFNSFKRFLLEAQTRGLITMSTTTFVGELFVALATDARGPSATAAPVAAPVITNAPVGDYGRSPIPNDLWRSFVDWNPGLKRCYHKPSGMALAFPERPIPMERPEHTAARDKWRQDPEQCVEIPAISMARQIEWMREFTEEVSDSGNRRLLEAALAADRPGSNFSMVLRGNSSLWTQWRAFRIRKVQEVVVAWAAANNIEVPLEDAPALPSKPRPPKIVSEGTAERALRSKIVAAVERMSIGDLRRLPIPVEYLEDL